MNFHGTDTQEPQQAGGSLRADCQDTAHCQRIREDSETQHQAISVSINPLKIFSGNMPGFRHFSATLGHLLTNNENFYVLKQKNSRKCLYIKF